MDSFYLQADIQSVLQHLSCLLVLSLQKVLTPVKANISSISLILTLQLWPLGPGRHFPSTQLISSMFQEHSKKLNHKYVQECLQDAGITLFLSETGSIQTSQPHLHLSQACFTSCCVCLTLLFITQFGLL